MTDRECGRNTDGTFGPGNPGKPKGARHKATQATLALLDSEAEALDPQGRRNRPDRRHDRLAPTVNFLCEARGETQAALLVGRGSCARETDEPEADFMARATRTASFAILSDKGREPPA